MAAGFQYYEVPGRSGLETHLREFVSSNEACPPWYVKVKDLENLGMVIKKADVAVQTSVTEGEFSGILVSTSSKITLWLD